MEARLRSRRRRKWAGYSDDRGWRLLWLRVEIASGSPENRCDNSALVSRQRCAARARAAHDKSPHAATTDFFQDTIAAQLPVPVRDIDRGEKRVEILDARFVRT